MKSQNNFQILWRQWSNYWFRPAPLFNLAVLRIVAVGFQLVYLFQKSFLSQLSEHAALPSTLYAPLPILQVFSQLAGWGDRPTLLVLLLTFWLTVFTGILSFIGASTNITLLIFALGNLLIQAYLYSFGDFHHPDALLIISLLILAFSPCGQILSVDDLKARLKHNIQRRQFSGFDLLAEKSRFAKWPLLLIQWLFSLIYLSAGLSKLESGGSWMNGYTLQYYLVRDGLRWGSDLGVWLGQHHELAIASSWFAVLFEVTFCFILLVPRLALIYVPLGIALHIGIYLAQRAPFFQFIALYVVFVPWTTVLRRLVQRQQPHQKQKPEILYDGLCPLCIRSMTVVRYFDWLNQLTYSDLELRWNSLKEQYPHLSLEDYRREMHVLLPNGSMKKGFFAFREILKYLPPLWPLLGLFYIPLAGLVGPKIYGWVASRRSRFQNCTYENCSIDAD